MLIANILTQKRLIKFFNFQNIQNTNTLISIHLDLHHGYHIYSDYFVVKKNIDSTLTKVNCTKILESDRAVVPNMDKISLTISHNSRKFVTHSYLLKKGTSKNNV